MLFLRTGAWLTVLIAGCLLGALPANAADWTQKVASVGEKLLGPTRVECTDFPLDELCGYLADFHDQFIALYYAELDKRGISDKTPITYTSLPGTRFEGALWNVLSPLKLSFVVDQDKLLITSQEKAADWQVKYLRATGRGNAIAPAPE